ncbi:unnamed protein product [Fusarium graminearum]|uniref:Chromosome 1, complete genome n=2 Tax=Gibberella zeae TaxID=5518 RepID=I1RFG4_GIBZE|nr:hypothetical protein FGSG_02438 [Fusarium graminearum PH-1]KAI6749986.1 hypothetical protein HG531_007251 [Fusarium graminearum]ESU07874.1 hypothetical protein FGSG_02438 [Fusarium graminearum PH-1]PCD39452.1 hypothetical protein FGRA07_00723 [Fusarium graminearum]CAF3578569.1 unnamed protein product [Fusarium graminearum]CAF3618084.1 unnamed protein product [Fusarium graminearum]|eukprot:XP_011318359.1 hypothetical protein FGSG_02438 [Fusarium graminearum PH-1]
MEKHKGFLHSVAEENSALATEIKQLAAQSQTLSQDKFDAAIKQCLLKIYDAIIKMSQNRGHPRTPRSKVFDAWESLLQPIKALTQLPFGDFLTARMLLYLAMGLRAQQALDLKASRALSLRPDFPLNQIDIAMDDTLVQALGRIWTNSDSSETFDWAFGEYSIGHWRVEDREKDHVKRHYLTAQALTPTELASLDNVGGKRFVFAKKNELDDTDDDWWAPFKGSVPGDNYERSRSQVHIPDDDEVEADEWVYKTVGTDGPIREPINCSIFDEREKRNYCSGLDYFPRSCQFITDARRIGQPLSTIKGRILAERGLSHAGIPPELRAAIFSYLDRPFRHAYLSKVDIVKAYAPFPNIESCSECDQDKQTCPTKSMYIWNVPLRTFFVFHRTKSNVGVLCKYGTNCQGHHEDNSWKITKEKDFQEYVEKIVKDRCGSTTTLSQVGFAPAADFTLRDREEDEKRSERLFHDRGPIEDSTKEQRFNGGLWGLVASMMHNKVLVGSWQGIDESSTCSTAAEWALARCLADKECAETAIKKIHSRCDRC